ncbi:MAG: putative lipid II flippase FtsW [Syntrophobacteraceae bacterium]|nr:putative lipid II flippase FtsW [Syntrophobacteraceae bacterium]
MSRTTSDTPFAAAQNSKERLRHHWKPLPLRVQLWVEVSLLISFGLIMIYSASSIPALKKFSDSSYYLKRQLFCILMGVGLMFAVSRIPYRTFKKYSGPLMLGILLMLILVLVPGIGVKLNNARRWLRVGPLHIQPAEYAKVVWVLFLSASLERKQDRIKQPRVSFWPYLILCGLFSVLLLKEPDFGSVFMFVLLMVIMMAVTGVPFRCFFLMAPFAILGFYRMVFLVPYRRLRWEAFLNPWLDPLVSGYQLIQGWIAVGSGGLFGKGLGAGQEKLLYLPESYTDFILAVIGEELGFVGILLTCVLFFLLFLTGLGVSRDAPDYFGSTLAMGLTMLISLEALLNMGVVLGLVPTKGTALPFISYGGSAFVASCIAAGMLLSIAGSCEKRADNFE